MNIPGFAFCSDADNIAKFRHSTALHVRELGGVAYTKSPRHGRTEFKGTLTGKASVLTGYEIAYYIDSFCFGGAIHRHGDTFHGHYNID